jgi:hypothetical protein
MENTDPGSKIEQSGHGSPSQQWSRTIVTTPMRLRPAGEQKPRKER